MVRISWLCCVAASELLQRAENDMHIKAVDADLTLGGDIFIKLCDATARYVRCVQPG